MSYTLVRKEFNTSVADILRNKGTVALIAEKSMHNFQMNSHRLDNLYHFTVQDSFRQIDLHKLFKIDDQTSQPTDYESLDFEYFKQIQGELDEVIRSLCNFNAHFLHSFDVINVEAIPDKILKFLKESFRLAVVQSYINEKIGETADRQTGSPLSDAQKDEIIDQCLNEEHKIAYFLKTTFYKKLCGRKRINSAEERQPANPEIVEFINEQFATLDKAIDFILFVETEEDIVWKQNAIDYNTDIDLKYRLKPITKGRYLSFNAMLFLLSMFLYKNEAKALIPKISGFKRSRTREDQRKLNVFMFYTKKFGSQDINNKDKKLIFVHEIMQYLGKYPFAWNKALEGDETQIVKGFKDAIFCRELDKQYPSLATNNDFKQFALEYLFRNKNINTGIYKWNLWKDLINKENKIIDVYNDIENNNLRARSYSQNYHYDYFVLKYLITHYYTDKARLVYRNVIDKNNMYEERFRRNVSSQKLRNRIAYNLIIPSYARNKDRFLEFGIRYLAENDYFGEQALFKMYKYHSSLEQQGIYETLNSKTRDKLKFKAGKEVTYKRYATSVKEYPDWDTPFVIENNAVFVKPDENSRPFAIQRDLMIYFLEDALYSENVKNCGFKIFEYFQELDREKDDAVELLQQRETIDKEEKNRFKRILPRHLLNNYLAAEQNDNNITVNSLQDILDQVEKQEKRYGNLMGKAIYLDKRQTVHSIKTDIEKSREALFYDSNKGKNFKLTFIRKSCHLMYFKNIYNEKSKLAGHHKSFHITRDEYNNFCKWMYTFDAVPCYKQQLIGLFTSKGFFENEEFRKIIEDSDNLNEIYEKVKQKYREWLVTNKGAAKKRKYNLESYDELLNKGVRYINVGHFRQFLARQDALQYRSLENTVHLIQEYYIEKPDDKTQTKLWNNLQKTRHEDCLLYKIALRYFEDNKTITQNIKTCGVDEFLHSVLEFRQEYKINGQRTTYTVCIPIEDADKWIELQKFSETKNLLQRLPFYLNRNQNTKELRHIAKKFDSYEKEITLSDLSRVNNHIIISQTKFTCCIMALEEFYIYKNSSEKYYKYLQSDEKNAIQWLEIKHIPVLNSYPGITNLNTALHFDLPMDKSYLDMFSAIEKRFAKEIDKRWTVATLPRIYKNVLTVFLDKVRTDIFDNSIVYQTNRFGEQSKKIDIRETQKKALEKYLSELQQINRW
jgi:hypothetical protein